MGISPCFGVRNHLLSFLIFLAVPRDLWDLSSPTRDWTLPPAVEVKDLSAGPPGFPPESFMHKLWPVQRGHEGVVSSKVALSVGCAPHVVPRSYFMLTCSRVLHWSTCEGPIFSQSVQCLGHVRLFATPWIAARQASLSITNSRSSPRLTSIESVMPSSHLILCCPLLLLPPIPPSIRVFSNESALHMRWPKYWSFSFRAYWAPTDPGSSSFSVLSFCLFMLFMGFSRQEYWSGLPFPSPVGQHWFQNSYFSIFLACYCVC